MWLTVYLCCAHWFSYLLSRFTAQYFLQSTLLYLSQAAKNVLYKVIIAFWAQTNASWELQYDGSSNGIRESNSLLSNSVKFSGSDYSLGIISVNKASNKNKQMNNY